ncbi:hypothetical protein ACFWBN_29120 [Streptomyces sp. NPDC059989]|uniref:hypothetical protein n=1 Tax=Streptomyces sp. NPDC059989 TaxID=3347026 RepID=UPI0036CA9D4B
MTRSRTQERSGRVRAGLAAGVLTVVLATGCSAGDGGTEGGDASSGPTGSAAGEVCHRLFAGDAEKSLTAALGSGTFARSTDRDSVQAATAELAAEPVAGGDTWRERRICTLYKDADSNVAELTVTAERVLPGVADAKHTDPDAARYRVGRNAWADPNRGVVYVDCVSPRLAGAEGASPAVLAVSAWNRTSPHGDAAAYRQANLTLAHAAAVALVKELGCKDSGGLQERLTVQEVPAG